MQPFDFDRESTYMLVVPLANIIMGQPLYRANAEQHCRSSRPPG